VNEGNDAIGVISHAIYLYRDYIEAFLARGQLYMKCRKYELALKDYEEVLRARPDQYLGYIGIA